MSYFYTIIRYTKCKHLLTVMFLPLCPKHLFFFFSNKTLMNIVVTSLRLNGTQLCHPSCIKHTGCGFVYLFCYCCRAKNNLSVSSHLAASRTLLLLRQSPVACRPQTAMQNKKCKMFKPHRTSGTFRELGKCVLVY